MLTGENGILNQAAKAKNETEKAKTNEALIIDEYNKFLNNAIGGTAGGGTIPEEPENQGTLGTVTGDEETPTEVKDSLDNKVVVPPGFTVQNPEDNVEDGIVIVDKNHGATAGSEFVWIPVGTIHTSNGDKTIKLSRYTFDESGVPIDQGENVIDIACQELASSTYGNTTAKDIEGFKASVKANFTGNLVEKGSNGTGIEDVICNVYDMACNCEEWSTETSSITGYPCVGRGGSYNSNGDDFTFYRGNIVASASYDSGSFRPILYL